MKPLAMSQPMTYTRAMNTTTALTPGTTFVNGSDGPHARAMPWGETLTIKYRDVQAYGVDRYMVADRNGRHGWAY